VTGIGKFLFRKADRVTGITWSGCVRVEHFEVDLKCQPGLDWSRFGERGIHGECSGAFDHDGQGNGEREKVILKAFAFLIAEPVCKEAEAPMNHGHGDQHVASDPESSDATEKAKNQTDASQEFCADGQEGKRRRNVHHVREETHSACETVAAEPAEGLLRAMRKKDYAKDQTKNSQDGIVGGAHEFAKHGLFLRCDV
jgi:hypothetical protein